MRAIRYAGEQLMDVTVSDPTHIERLEITNAELERTNRELEAFVHLIAHDLKTPLQVVSGFLELLHERSAQHLDATSSSYLTEAKRGAARMEHLIDDVLSAALSPNVESTKEPVDLRALFNEALVDYFPMPSSETVTVTVGTLPTVEGSPMMLRRLFVNLVSNALKFHRPDTAAVVVVDAVDAAEGAGECTIRVTDNGIGVPIDARDSVFAIYRRLDRSIPGSGIGLAICQRIVLAHRGRIWIEEGIDGGTRVCFTLPTLI
jgi:signal transduction histidine kinase